jgi:hypothetical protein
MWQSRYATWIGVRATAKSGSLKEFPYPLFDRRHKKHLSEIRDSYGQVNQQIFDLCCTLQRHFDPKDLERASFLAAELNSWCS